MRVVADLIDFLCQLNSFVGIKTIYEHTAKGYVYVSDHSTEDIDKALAYLIDKDMVIFRIQFEEPMRILYKLNKEAYTNYIPN